MKINKTITNIFNDIKTINHNSSDIVTRIIKIKNNYVGYIFLESVSSDDKISDFLNKSIINLKFTSLFNSIYHSLYNSIFNSHISICYNYEELFYYLSSGYTAIVFNNEKKAIVVETKAQLDRGIVESSSEPIIRGPKDSFTENHSKNIGLIRKRIKDSNLIFDEIKIGKRTKTKVSISYIKDIVDYNKIDNIKKILEGINIDGIIDSGYIREFIEGKQNSIFPKMISTERPDLACTSLLNGKIIIMVENSPFILILPAVFTDFIHSPEDYYEKPFNASFNRIIRTMCFFIALITPALYIALMTYNQEIIPDQLLISLAIQRENVPFPTAIEVLIFVLTFELLREADIHSPSFSGSAMNIVGALILGDAAVAAGVVSPIVIIIVAITSISELVFYDIDMINGLREWRIAFILSATLLGIFGIVLIFIMFIAKLSSIECLDTPYLTPLSPLNIDSLKDSFIRFPRYKLKKRPQYLTNNRKKLGE